MAQYKVPQDVEADDKLIGPFSFRQFVYLLIAAGLIALAVGLFQLFPLLVIIPIPFALLFLALALPLKKDQPMETYLAALVSFYLKPRVRKWMPGQRESTVLITAPKIVEDARTRDISGEEATHRLSFLADIVDSEGYAIRGGWSNSSMREDLVAEANATEDMFDTYEAGRIGQAATDNMTERHREAIREMQAALNRNDTVDMSKATIKKDFTSSEGNKVVNAGESSGNAASVVAGVAKNVAQKVEKSENVKDSANSEKTASEKPVKNDIMELANNPEYSVATIAKEANRIKRKDEGEVFISLH